MKNYKLLAKLLITLSVLFILFLKMDLSALEKTADHVQILLWIPAAILIVLQMITMAWRWHAMVNDGQSQISFPTALRITLAGNLANILFIASIGGIIARVALTMHHGMNLVCATSAAIIDRLMTLAALIFLAGLFAPLVKSNLDPAIFWIAEISLLSMIGGLALLPWIIRNILRIGPDHPSFRIGMRYMQDILASPRLLAVIVTSSILGLAFYFTSIAVLAEALVPDIDRMLLLAMLPVIVLIASLPISFGGWGVREGAFVYGLGLIGITPEIAFLISIQIGFLSTASTILAGLPSLMHRDVWSAIQRKKAPA